MTTEESEKTQRGEHHLDEREPLAFAYYGTKLVAVGYTREIVNHWEERTDYEVSRTPRGEA
jgi:hypothetical protein